MSSRNAFKEIFFKERANLPSLINPRVQQGHETSALTWGLTGAPALTPAMRTKKT